MKYKHFKQALLFKVGSLLKFRKLAPHALKGQKLQKQHALKGQKLLAQGSALGYYGRKLVAL